MTPQDYMIADSDKEQCRIGLQIDSEFMIDYDMLSLKFQRIFIDEYYKWVRMQMRRAIIYGEIPF